jgi:mono/diheme cytochrome c family protein
LYRRHCLHCHGLTGDGHGPTAPWVNPHPRDYRAGKFKFMSVMGGTLGDKARKPTRADLIRTLKQGIEGTSMPTFGLLPEEQLNDLVSYVIHLSLRGNLEYQLVRFVFGEDPDNPSKVAVAPMISDAESTLGEIVQEWAKAEGEPIPADSFPAGAENLNSAEGQASIQRGHRLFLGLGVNQASCVSCHADYGRQITFKYDEWGTVVRPRDLTAGIYRGGRRPIDLYYRIFSGIHGTPMPAFAGENGPKRNRDIWDLVNFVRALPYPGMLPEEVRNQIYPEKAGQTRAALAQRD